jgi:hypothetical protein
MSRTRTVSGFPKQRPYIKRSISPISRKTARTKTAVVKAHWQSKVMDQMRYIEGHDYSQYDRPSSPSNGSEKVYKADLAYLKRLLEEYERI